MAGTGDRDVPERRPSRPLNKARKRQRFRSLPSLQAANRMQALHAWMHDVHSKRSAMMQAPADLDPRRPHWVPSVVAPARDWPGMPGCRRGARFLIHRRSFRPARAEFAVFDSRAECLRWIMQHRTELNRNAPDARIVPVDLARWMLGLD